MHTDPLRLARYLLAGSLAVAGLPAVAHATVFHARDEAIAMAFPGAERVEPRDFVLTDEQRTRIEAMAQAPLESSLVTVYVGWQGGSPFAYALIDTHTVRSFPEALLVVISPEGAVQATHVLAFHEPEEYLPTSRWLAGFAGKRIDEELQVGRGIAAITGSTMSTRAVTAGIRRALAIWAVTVGGK